MYLADRKRLNRVAVQFLKTGSPRTETRGGARKTERYAAIRQSIKNHIKQFPATSSHYARAKTGRQYLSSELNIHKMWTMWKERCAEDNLPTASLEMYRHVFKSCFNLSFRPPYTDRCSYCEVLKKRIAAKEDIEKTKVQFKLHKLRAKKFHQLMAESKKARGTLTLVFDLMQNQPLPKIGISEEFYARQLWVHNMGIVVHRKRQNKNDVRLYTWLESEAGRGANEICSALHDCLHRMRRSVIRRKYNTLHLYCDSCGGQNKNSAMLASLWKFVHSKQCPFTNIRVFFPVRGHSYMPPDQVFGRIEKEIRKRQLFRTPDDYYSIFKKHGVHRPLNSRWYLSDYTRFVKSVAFQKSYFARLQIRESKVWYFSKSSLSVGISKTYSGLPQYFPILNKKFSKEALKPLISSKLKRVPCTSHVSLAKKS